MWDAEVLDVGDCFFLAGHGAQASEPCCFFIACIFQEIFSVGDSEGTESDCHWITSHYYLVYVKIVASFVIGLALWPAVIF